jgi:hypothetical protein
LAGEAFLPDFATIGPRCDCIILGLLVDPFTGDIARFDDLNPFVDFNDGLAAFNSLSKARLMS